jgi:hypothetical protein
MNVINRLPALFVTVHYDAVALFCKAHVFGNFANCLFCKIIAGEIPSEKIYEDEDVYAFHDIMKC